MISATASPEELAVVRSDDLAESCASLFARVILGRRARMRGAAGPGWTMVGTAAVGLYFSDTFGQVTFDTLAATLRKAYARGYGRAGQEVPWEETSGLTRLAWEAVARHVAWAVGNPDARFKMSAAETHRATWAEGEITKREIVRGK